MKYAIPLSTLLLLCLSASCTNNRFIAFSLKKAESIMQEQPDSALHILQTIDRQAISKDVLQARYALLYTQALDKNSLPIPDDSLINIAVEYYSRKKDYRRWSWALLYQGTAYMQMDSTELAITSFIKTQELLNRYPDDNLLGIVTSRMGKLYEKQRHFPEALELNRASLAAFRKNGNTQNESYVLGSMGNIFYISKISIDSAEIYYNKAKELAILGKDSAYRYNLEISLCSILRTRKESQKAKEMLMGVIMEMDGKYINPVLYYPLLSMLFLDLQQIDSARHYMKVVLDDTLASANRRAGALSALKTIEERAGNTALALQYAYQYKALSDSIKQTYIAHDVRVIDGKYRQQRLRDEMVKQRIRYILLFSSLGLVSVASVAGIVIRWRRRMVRNDLLKGWNYALLVEKYQSTLIDLTKEAGCVQVIATANHSFPGLIEWLKRDYPQLNTTDTALLCLLLSDFGPKELCPLYKVLNPGAMYTRCSRLYKKMGIQTDPKDPLSFRNELTHLYVQKSM